MRHDEDFDDLEDEFNDEECTLSEEEELQFEDNSSDDEIHNLD